MPVLRFGLLGPVTAEYDGRPVPLGPPQRRAVLACLLLARGRAVTVAALKEMLWSDAVPASAANAIQGHVHHLRRTFDEFAPEPLLITHPGQPSDRVSYTLRADAGGVDVMRFETLVREGEAAASRGDSGGAVERFDEALALWRGEPLADLDSDYFRAVRRGKEELRADVEQRRAAALRATAWALPSAPPPAPSRFRAPSPLLTPQPSRSAARELVRRDGERRAQTKESGSPLAEARVLGPLELLVGGVDVTPAASRRRALLASLLRQPGQVVTPETLIEDIWGEGASANAPAQLQNHVHLLRKRIDQVSGPGAGKRVLERKPAGYVLNAGATDRDQFHSLVDEAGGAFLAMAHGRAVDLATQALELFRGAPFAGVPLGSPRMVDTARLLEEQRYEALHLKIEAQILLGESSRVVPELRNVVERERPEDEGLLRLLIKALERTGRTAEARILAGRLPRERHEDVPWPHGDRLEVAGESIRPAPRQHRPVTRSGRGEVPRLRFAVLGPVRVQHGGEPVNTGSPQQRGVLAALLLRAGRTATAPELIDALWGDDPPHAALAALRTYASRLRKVLGGDVLVSESGGYALRLDDSWFDLEAAQKWADEAGRAREAGDRVSALTLLDRALGLWQGEPLATLPGPYMEEQRTRLAEWRLQLVEARCELMLELGRHAEAVTELTALTAAHPLRERLRELLMLALYRSGRQSEALAVYADTRRLLADELGVNPRPELSELQQRILQADVEPAQSVESAVPLLVRPSQLPPDISDFVGHDDTLQRIGAQLSADADAWTRTVVVTGMGGVGKSALAVRAAYGARHEFPGGQLYADLGGTAPHPTEPGAVLGSFLRALGVPDSTVPDGVGERAALFRSVLDGHRMLIVLDNAHDAAQVRPLLPAAPGCGTIVTSRVRMPGLPNAYPVDLGVLSPQEAFQLFSGIVGRERAETDRGAVMKVVAACGFLPLAIRMAANFLAARRTWPVSVLARRLTDERRGLSELGSGYLNLEEVFAWSCRQLPPAQARAFRLLGLATAPEISLAAAAALLGADEDAAAELLESLADRSLLESPAPGHYRMHPLLRAYTRTRAQENESPEAGAAASDRFRNL
ncbi:BTAD domain-containing putative transcriptional regulator [Streptomyces sp. XH2]|uniref:AfsR/SARP family transcriptional regulator n=1 Tax=Streptomyces sp. XH2 TaxID=3412483 RepID=UPI003C7BE79F